MNAVTSPRKQDAAFDLDRPLRGQAVGASSRTSVVDVVAGVDEAIATGRMVPGQRLIEADLTNEFGASRSVVREALRFLEGDGVVEIVPNRGARIKRLDPMRLVRIQEVYGVLFRGSLETLVSRPIPRQVKAKINAALKAVVDADKTGRRFDRVKAAFDYHYTICSNCGNPYFSEALDRLHVRQFIRHPEVQFVHDENADLASAYTNATREILKRDLAAARAYLNPIMARLEACLEEQAKRRR